MEILKQKLKADKKLLVASTWNCGLRFGERAAQQQPHSHISVASVAKARCAP